MFYNIFPQKFNFYFKILRSFKIFNNEMYMYTISVKNFKSPCLSCINYFCGKIIYAGGLSQKLHSA